MKSRISLVLSDVDGTLVTDKKVLTDRSCEAVAKLREAGILFAVTSARPPRGLQMLIKPLQLSTPIAGFNGGLFVYPDMTTIEEHPLDPKMAQEAVDAIYAHKMEAWVFTARTWFVRDLKGAHVDHETRTVQFGPTVVEDFTNPLNKAIKIVGVSDDFALVERAEKDLQALCGHRGTALRSQKYYLDITHPEANKGNVVTTLTKLLSIPASEIMTIGDGQNDVLMFRKSGQSVAMGNAAPETQRQATYVTATNAEEGFAEAIERYVLGGLSENVGIGQANA